jgi:hypothetical protein
MDPLRQSHEMPQYRLRVDDYAIALILKPHQFPYCRRNQQCTGNQVALNLSQDLVGCLVVRVPILACGRRTGVPVNRLVSGQE